MQERPDATDRQIKNVKNWFHNNPNAIHIEETKFLDAEDGLTALIPRRRVPLRNLINHFDWLLRWTPLRVKDVRDGDNKQIVHNKNSIIDGIMTFLVVSVGVGMLLAPLWILQTFMLHPDMNTFQTRLGIISGFIILTTALLSGVTRAQPFEVLGATAAYSAVMMIYIQVGVSTSQKNVLG